MWWWWVGLIRMMGWWTKNCLKISMVLAIGAGKYQHRVSGVWCGCHKEETISTKEEARQSLASSAPYAWLCMRSMCISLHVFTRIIHKHSQPFHQSQFATNDPSTNPIQIKQKQLTTTNKHMIFITLSTFFINCHIIATLSDNFLWIPILSIITFWILTSSIITFWIPHYPLFLFWIVNSTIILCDPWLK